MDKLLTDPDILKKMNEAKKQTSVSRHTISSFGLQRVKTQMKMKFDYSMKNIDSNVEKEVRGMLKENDRNKVKNLPSNFFERILILEMELEADFSLSTLNELIAQYSVIII